MAEQVKEISKSVRADDVFTEAAEQDASEDLSPKVDAVFKMSADNKSMIITVPLTALDTQIRWSEKTNEKTGNRRKHGLLVATGKVPDGAEIFITRSNGQKIACKAIGKTLAINLGFNPMMRRILTTEAPAK